jgi:hypothetical protein
MGLRQWADGVGRSLQAMLTAMPLIPTINSKSSSRFHFLGWTYLHCT